MARSKFIHSDLGQRQRGEIVEITLRGSAANIRLLDSNNFSKYRSGRRHSFSGGLAERSPVRLQIPRSGHWHVVVDMQGLQGQTNASFRMLPSPLPAINERPLSEIPSLVREPTPSVASDSDTFDVFISHASEDKDQVARPLAEALRELDLEVWFDEFELKIGDSLRQKIDKGLARSRFGVIVLSRTFISKGWTNYELDGVVSRSVNGDQVMLPIWHDITKAEVVDYSPSLADKVARNTSSFTITEIAKEIFEVIRSN